VEKARRLRSEIPNYRVSRRPAPPPPSWSDYAFAVRDTFYYFAPRSGMIHCALGLSPRAYAAKLEFVRGRGRAFDTWAEVNAYAANHGWPNWTPCEG